MFYFSHSPHRNFPTHTIDYDGYWKDRGFSINKKLKEREVIMLEHISKGSRVLDIGCGNSLLPLKLKEKGCTVSVADISSIVLAEFKKHGLGTLQLDLEKTETLKLASSYDYIILSEVLEHTRNPEEILLTLKPYTANFILTVPNSAFYRYRLHLLFTGRFLRQWVHHPSEHLRYWSHTDFLDWLQALGFSVSKSVASNGLDIFGLKFFQYFPNLFGHQICYFVNSALARVKV